MRFTQDVVTAHFCKVHTDRSSSFSSGSAMFTKYGYLWYSPVNKHKDWDTSTNWTKHRTNHYNPFSWGKHQSFSLGIQMACERWL